MSLTFDEWWYREVNSDRFRRTTESTRVNARRHALGGWDAAIKHAAQCDGYAGDPGASAPRCESYRGHPGPHFIRLHATQPVTR